MAGMSAVSPEEIESEIVALLERSEVAEAVGRARQALDRRIETPLLLNLRAFWLEGENRPAEALVDLQRARALAPQDPAIANALGLCLAKLGRLEEAYAAFRSSAELAPGFGPAHFNCGWSLEDLGELDAAREAFEAAARTDAKWPDPPARLAALAARRGQWELARTHAEHTLALAPDHAAAGIALAGAELATKSYAEAKARLGRIIEYPGISLQDRATAIGLLGDVLDAQARYGEAFAAYTASNAVLRGVFEASAAVQAQMPMGEYVQWLSDRFAGTAPWPKSEVAAAEGPERLIFVLGFPRSGTTLLEEVLAAHPKASTTGERDALGVIVRDLFANPAQVDRLETLDAAGIAEARTRYWEIVRGFGIPVEGCVLIDKQPFNTIRLPLIAKLFPEAKVLFCLRDPRDVVLSCFRRRFALNAANAEFLTLESAARLYDAVMRLAVVYRAKLPVSLIEILKRGLGGRFRRAYTNHL